MNHAVPLEQVIRFVETKYPALWKLVYPRVYDNIGQYNSPRIVAASMANGILARKLDFGNSVWNQYVVASKLHEHSMPTFFVPRHIVETVNKTDLPLEMAWTEIHMPHPALSFCFERGSLLGPNGEHGFVALARFHKGDEIGHPFSRHLDTVQNSGLIMHTAAHETEDFAQFDLSLTDQGSPTIDKIALVEEPRHQHKDLVVGLDMSTVEMKWNQYLVVLAIKLVLLMNARPELVEHGQMRKAIKVAIKNSCERREFWAPNIIGRNYRVSEQSDGDGAKKRLHWRRGHFAWQPYGPLHSLRKMIWREPVMVGDVTT